MRSYQLYALIAVGFIALLGTAWYHSAVREVSHATSAMKLSSTAFAEGGTIPEKYTCDAGQISPPLTFSDVPEGVKSFALIVEDPDVPKQIKPDGLFVHWVLFNISPDTREILENSPVGIVGSNGAGKNSYAGPCPPREYEPSRHRYVFTLYALDAALELESGAGKNEVLQSMQGHVIARAALIGTYKKK